MQLQQQIRQLKEEQKLKNSDIEQLNSNVDCLIQKSKMLEKQYNDIQFEEQTLARNLNQLQKDYEYQSLEL